MSDATVTKLKQDKDGLPTIQAALANVMADVREVAKRDRNNAQGFNFRGIDAVVNAVGPALRAHNVIVMPEVLEDSYGTVEVGAKRTPMGHARLKVRYFFTGPAGDWMSATVVGEAMDSGDKATAKAMSVCFRTALLQALALPTDDPDPDSHSYERSAPAPIVEKKPLTDEVWTSLVTEMTTAKELDGLNELATRAATYALSEEQRNELKALFLERKALLA